MIAKPRRLRYLCVATRLLPLRQIRFNVTAMNTVLSPIESEFATTEEAEAYERWFRAKVQESLDDNGPLIPHDQVMAEMQAIIDTKRREHATRTVAD